MERYLKEKKVLLVDDEEEILNLVQAFLRQEGFEHIALAKTSKQALALAKSFEPDVAILDIMLPDGDGFALFATLRQQRNFPVLFLSARDEAQSKLTGLGLGADDYIAKPFLPQELVLRLQAVLRRCYKEQATRLSLAACEIDFDQALVFRQDETLSLTAMEFRLLETLAQNLGRIVTVDTICEALWGSSAFGYENSLNAHIRRIREKIEANPSKPVSLLTIKGLGYKLVAKAS